MPESFNVWKKYWLLFCKIYDIVFEKLQNGLMAIECFELFDNCYRLARNVAFFKKNEPLSQDYETLIQIFGLWFKKMSCYFKLVLNPQNQTYKLPFQIYESPI